MFTNLIVKTNGKILVEIDDRIKFHKEASLISYYRRHPIFITKSNYILLNIPTSKILLKLNMITLKIFSHQNSQQLKYSDLYEKLDLIDIFIDGNRYKEINLYDYLTNDLKITNLQERMQICLLGDI